MFDWLKSKSRRETGRLNALLAEVFTQLGEERLRQAVADGAVARFPRGVGNCFDVVFSPHAAAYENLLPKQNAVFHQIAVRNAAGQHTRLEITVIDNLPAGIAFDNAAFDFTQPLFADTGMAARAASVMEQALARRLAALGFVGDIPVAVMNEVEIKGQTYLRLQETADGDFVGLGADDALYWCRHAGGVLAVPPELSAVLRERLFAAPRGEMAALLASLLDD